MRTIVGDFYEDDEPVEDVRRAFEAGEHGLTAPPVNATLNLAWGLSPLKTTAAAPSAVRGLSPLTTTGAAPAMATWQWQRY